MASRVGATIMRARDLGVITADRARSLQVQLSSQGRRTNEPLPVEEEKPLLLGAKFSAKSPASR